MAHKLGSLGYATPVVLLSEDLIERGDLRVPGPDATGGVILLFGHGELPDETVKDAAKRALLAWLDAECADEAAFTWNDAVHDLPARVWTAAGLTLLGTWSIEDAALLNAPVR